jgi:hypothetical protein
MLNDKKTLGKKHKLIYGIFLMMLRKFIARKSVFRKEITKEINLKLFK